MLVTSYKQTLLEVSSVSGSVSKCCLKTGESGAWQWLVTAGGALHYAPVIRDCLWWSETLLQVIVVLLPWPITQPGACESIQLWPVDQAHDMESLSLDSVVVLFLSMTLMMVHLLIIILFQWEICIFICSLPSHLHLSWIWWEN